MDFSISNYIYDVNRLDKMQTALYLGGVCPTLRRIQSLPDSIHDNNNLRAGMLVGLAAANLPGDVREMLHAKNEIKNIFTQGKLPSAAQYRGQHAMGLFRGTFLDKYANKLPWLMNADKSLAETRFGTFITKKLGIIGISKELVIPGLEIKGKQIIAERTVGSVTFNHTFAKNLLGKTLLRIPVLGVAAAALLEIPALINSVTKTQGSSSDKAKAFGVQLAKSSGFVGLTTLGIAAGGALLSATGVGALIGMAAGGALSIMASHTLNKAIDDVVAINNKEQVKQPAPANIFI